MKIAIKRDLNLNNDQRTSLDKTTVVYIQLNPSNDSNQFLLNTIDYDDVIDYDVEKEFDLQLQNFTHSDNYYVLHYDREVLIFVTLSCDDLKPKYKVKFDDLCRSLQMIYDDNDFDFLEQEAFQELNLTLEETDDNNIGLPKLYDYIQRHKQDFNTIYYPGTGLDFSPLQIFGTFADNVSVYLTDYMNHIEFDQFKNRIDESFNQDTELTPQHFNKTSWEDFWSDDPRVWSEYHHPTNAWGKKIDLQINNHICSLFYLGTEAVRTLEVLFENKIIPDVLVLQDHMTTAFSGTDSMLYKAMQSNLPKYILAETESLNTIIWPGYKQVTLPHIGEIYQSLPQNKNPRALFKRMK